VDRGIQVRLAPGRLQVDYEVSLAELTLVQDLRGLGGDAQAPDRQALLRRYGDLTGPLNARGLLVTVDGRPVELSFRSFALFTDEPHPRYVFRLEAPLPPRGRLELRDTNYVSSEGISRLALAASGLAVSGYEGPPDLEAVPYRPLWQLTDEEERRTKGVAVQFGPPAGTALTSTDSTHQHGSSNKGATSPTRTPPRGAGPGSGLAALLDRAARASLPLVLLAALGLGAAHAIQPGHGKTLVAAAGLSGRGGPLQAALLAIVATVAHTGGVAAIAAILWWTGTDEYRRIDRALVAGAGFLVAAVGLWRLGRHLGGHGEHDHAHGSSDVNPSGGILSTGLAVGLVPCWDAVLLVVLAAAIGRIGLGLLLLGAFSAGMAGVLVAVGLAAGTLRRRLEGRDTARLWERRLGLLSGAILTVLGLGMLSR
jgi:ABC-type nickel/cobalt efflux system permease component RcnA